MPTPMPISTCRPPTLLVVLAAIVTAACGASFTAGGDSQTTTLRVSQGGDSLLEPAHARLTAAIGAVERAFGHPMHVELDRALASERRDFGEVVARELETLARELASARRADDFVLESLLAEVDHIEVRYEPVRVGRALVLPRRAVVLALPVGARWNALEPVLRERDRRLDARYATATPRDVRDEELGLYEWWRLRELQRDGARRRPEVVRALMIVDERGAHRAGEPARALRASARSGVLHAMLAMRSPDPWRREPSGTDAPIRSAFVTWANAVIEQLDADGVDTLARVVATDPPLPGLETDALVMRAADAWVTAGRPQLAWAASDDALPGVPLLVTHLMCPGNACPNLDLYEAIAASAERTATLWSKTEARRDPRLRVLVLAHLLEGACDTGHREICARMQRDLCGAAGTATEGSDDLLRRIATRCETARQRR